MKAVPLLLHCYFIIRELLETSSPAACAFLAQKLPYG